MRAKWASSTRPARSWSSSATASSSGTPRGEHVVGEAVDRGAPADGPAVATHEPRRRAARADRAPVDGHPADRQHPVGLRVETRRLDVDGEQGQLVERVSRRRERDLEVVAQGPRVDRPQGAHAALLRGPPEQAHET